MLRDLSEAIAAKVARKAMAGDRAAARHVFDGLAAGTTDGVYDAKERFEWLRILVKYIK